MQHENKGKDNNQRYQYCDWDSVEVIKHPDKKNISIIVETNCPNNCGETIRFIWQGPSFPGTYKPEFEAAEECALCGYDFDPPLLPGRKTIIKWWGMAILQEKSEVRECFEEEERRAPRKSEKKGKKRKKKQSRHLVVDSSWEFGST